MHFFVYKGNQLFGCGAAALMHAAAELNYGVLQPEMLAHSNATRLYQSKFAKPIHLAHTMCLAQSDLTRFQDLSAEKLCTLHGDLYEQYKQRLTSTTSPVAQLWHLEECIFASTKFNDFGHERPDGSWPSSLVRVAQAMGFHANVGILDTPQRRILESLFPLELGILSGRIYPHFHALSSMPCEGPRGMLQSLHANSLPICNTLPNLQPYERALCLIETRHWIVMRPNHTFFDPAIVKDVPIAHEKISLFIKIHLQ